MNSADHELAARDGLEPAARRLAMLSVALGVGMASLDTAIANTALPAIADQLRTTPAASVWIVNVYQLAMVATLLPFAALGEVIGYRRVCIFGLAVFTAASLACALAWSLPSLVIARLFQGIGGPGGDLGLDEAGQGGEDPHDRPSEQAEDRALPAAVGTHPGAKDDVGFAHGHSAKRIRNDMWRRLPGYRRG